MPVEVIFISNYIQKWLWHFINKSKRNLLKTLLSPAGRANINNPWDGNESSQIKTADEKQDLQ